MLKRIATSVKPDCQRRGDNMEIVVAVVMCGFFGLWIWNLKSEVVDLRKRLMDESSRLVMVYGPIRSTPVKAPASIRKPARGVLHDEESTWIMN
jgi:hypothetical protein